MEHYYILRDGAPGRRFRNYVKIRRERRGSPYSAARVVSFINGISLMVIGLGIGWLPGPGGFLAIIGLALIAQEIPVIAAILDRIELIGRKSIRSVKYYFRAGPTSGSSVGKRRPDRLA